MLNGTLGLNTIVSVSEESSNSFSTNSAGIGDVLMGLNIQFPPVTIDGRPVFSQGFELDVFAPTGKYDASRTINPGNNFWSISPFWKAT